MQNNKKSAGSQFVSPGQLFAMLKDEQATEFLSTLLLYIVGAVLTPITLFGALMGYKGSYSRFGFPRGEKPVFANLKPIMLLSMIAGAVFTWCLIGILMGVIFKISGSLFRTDFGYQVTFIFILFNVIISFILFKHFKRWQRATANNLIEVNRFGSARWAKEEDMADLERKPGIYIGGGYYAYDKQGHVITMGAARGGKGINCILPNLLGLSGYNGSWFIIDVKGELAAVSARYQREKGQNVLILDPWNLQATTSTTFNPLDLVTNQTNPDNLIDDISIIAEMIVPKEANSDQFWNNKARSLIAGMVLHLILSQEKTQQSLGKIWEWLRLPQENLEELFADMAISDSAIVNATAHEFISVMHTASKMFHSILSAAQEKTDFLKSPTLRKSLSSSSFDIKDITNGKTTLYVIIPPDKLDSHFQWLRLVMTTCLRSAVRNRNKRITFLLDEFAALGFLPEMRTAFSTYAGYNITMWPIVQDLGQLHNLYGQSWETFINNSSVRQFISVSDVFSLEYLEKLFGTTTIINYDSNGRAQASSRPLVTADEIRRGSADNIFAFIEQRPAACFPKLPYYDMPTMFGRYDDNPYHK